MSKYYKVGDKVKCITTVDPFGNRSVFLNVGKTYKIENISINDDGGVYFLIDINVGKLSYHSSHFISVQKERREKLEKLKNENWE